MVQTFSGSFNTKKYWVFSFQTDSFVERLFLIVQRHRPWIIHCYQWMTEQWLLSKSPDLLFSSKKTFHSNSYCWVGETLRTSKHWDTAHVYLLLFFLFSPCLTVVSGCGDLLTSCAHQSRFSLGAGQGVPAEATRWQHRPGREAQRTWTCLGVPSKMSLRWWPAFLCKESSGFFLFCRASCSMWGRVSSTKNYTGVF